MPVDGGTAAGQGAGGNTSGNGGGAGGQGAGAPGSYTVPAAAGASAHDAAGSDRDGGRRGSRREGAREAAQDIVDRLVQRHGGLERALDVLAADNYELREDKRELTDKLRLLPPPGAVVLVGDDVGRWQGYNALNLPPDKVKEALADRDRLAADASKTTTATLAQTASTALGYKNPQALAHLIQTEGLQVELRDAPVVENGATVMKKVPMARKAAEANAAWVPLGDLVKSTYSWYGPALATDPQGGTGAAGAPGTAAGGGQGAAPGTGAGGTAATAGVGGQGPAGTVVVIGDGGQTATPAAGGAPLSMVDQAIAANQKASQGWNPLRPAKPAGT